MWWKQIHFYPYFKKETVPIKEVLTKNEQIYFDDILIARKTKSKSYQYAKLNNIEHFINLYNKCTIEEKSFYAVFTEDIRYLYIDVDYYLHNKINNNKKKEMIISIIKALNEFNYTYGYNYGIKIHKKPWMIWDATRHNKFSLHLINDEITADCSIIHKYILQFNEWKKINKILPDECKIDTSIYSKKYQLWKLPGNHGGHINSVLQFIDYDLLPTQRNYNISFVQQLKINFMCNIQQKKCKPIYIGMQYNALNLKHKISKNNKITNTKTKMIQNSNCYNKNGKILNSHIKKEQNINLIDMNYNQMLQKIFGKNYELTTMVNNNDCIAVNRITKHYCTIIKRCHKRNSGKIELYKNNYLVYIKYFCMDEYCKNKYQHHSLINEINRPWLFNKIVNLDKQIILDVDLFIDLLFKQQIIHYKENKLMHEIINKRTILFNHDNNIFSTFIHYNIIHYLCRLSDMRLSYKSDNNRCVNYGKVTLYCNYCKIFYNLKNQKISVL